MPQPNRDATPLAGGDPRISLTAYATAGAWVRYGFAEAHHFDNRRTRAAFLGLRALTGAFSPLLPVLADFGPQLYWRHRWIDDWIACRAPGLALELGAGLSPRGLAYARDHAATQWIDCDLPGIVAARRALLGAWTPPDNYRLQDGDLLDPAFGETLEGVASAAVVVVTEGVIDYLDRAEKIQVWRAIAGLLRRLGGGRYVCDINPLDKLRARGRTASRVFAPCLSRLGRSLFDDAEQSLALLRYCGFDAARILPESMLVGAAEAPVHAKRLFSLVEADIAVAQPGR